MKDRLQTFFYWLNVQTWVRLIVTLVIRQDVKGLENVPRRGALVLASNHLNLADPPILTFLMPRRVVWMAKQELFDIPVAGLLYRMFGCIPVRRFEADLRALRRSQQALRRGHVLGMFPEGTRSGGLGLKQGEPGTALLALRSGAPVLPVAIWGTEGMKLPRDFFRRTHVRVAIGQPFRLPQAKRIDKEQVEAGTEEIMRRIAALLPPEYRGEYAEAAARPAAVARERNH